MKHKFYFKNKAASTAVTTHSGTKRNIPSGLSFAITLCVAHTPLTNHLNRAECGYQVHGTEREISHLLYMDDLKLLGRNGNHLKIEIKIAHKLTNI